MTFPVKTVYMLDLKVTVLQGIQAMYLVALAG